MKDNFNIREWVRKDGRTLNELPTNTITEESSYKEGHDIDEGYYGSSDLENTINTLGYDSFEDFFNDNQGAEEAVDEFINSVKAFREILGREDDSDIYEDYDADEEQDDEGVLNEGKGQKEADKLVYRLRETLFKKLNDAELDEFKATLKTALDL